MPGVTTSKSAGNRCIFGRPARIGKGDSNMPQVAQPFFKTGIVWLIVGIAIGLHMGISGDHRAFPAHAHINLLGWVTSTLFGGYCALNPAKAQRKLAVAH
ncbi:putative signal peptide protein [Mesorhizobium alhagi CCNWXJ12-2]|uniref:Putative signal peptide protein n=1 Tax=Mesorhizobium alhagi CCNWXJ12-2 TaxID=1107882 RepID=H0HYH0_9HYPH|nr:putative signal peptide protein [Mesorhizobium alhagi CCNWXJ12-2]